MDAAYHSASEESGWRDWLRRHARSWLAATAAAVAVRLLFILRWPFITPDSFVYGDLAKNWLLHGVYGLSGAAGPTASYIRLPGYPALLAGLWALAGVAHYNAARYVQLLLDVGTCWVIADMARRTLGARAARLALWLAALCPFLATYVALPLTETPATFCAALALDLALCGLGALDNGRLDRAAWAGCGLSIAAGIYLRPDGGIVLMAVGACLLWRLARWRGERGRILLASALLAVCALAPLVPWTVRNWRVMHRLQPLAPESATDPGEFVPRGFERWQKTWLVDYASLEDIGFRVSGERMAIEDLPARACDSVEERLATEELFDAYNRNLAVTPALDARFGRLAEERIRRAPVRYYFSLPLLRAGDMWLRPRTEMLPVDAHWWRYWEDAYDFAIAGVLALLNLAYLGAAALGLRRGGLRGAGLLAGFVLLRTVILAAIAGPETRYVLECYPVVIVLAAALGQRNVSR